MPAIPCPSNMVRLGAFLALILLLLTSTHGVETRNEVFEGKKIAVTEVDLAKDQLQLFLNDELVVKDKKVMFRPGRHPGPTEEG